MMYIGLLVTILTSCGRYQTGSSNPEEPEDVPTPLEVTTPAKSPPETPALKPPSEEPVSLAESPRIQDSAIISEDGKTITVHNAKELINHMAPDRHFILMPGGDYDLYSLDPSINPQYFEYGLKNLRNVTIEGFGSQQVNFFTVYGGDDVLTISNCENIILKNLNLGHDPLPVYAYCSGAVLVIQDSTDIQIDQCTMFGCGTVGIVAKNATELTCSNSVIRNCTVNVMELSNTKALFENCSFINNTDEAIRLYGQQDVIIRNCRLEGILSGYPPILLEDVSLIDKPNDGEEYMIRSQQYRGIRLEDILVVGQSIIHELEAIHKNVTAAINTGVDAMTDRTTISCTLTYKEPLDDAEYLPQIEAARKVISKNSKKDDIIYVLLSWPGISNSIRTTYYGSVWLWDSYKDIGRVMGDRRQYMTLDEATTLLKEWMPPLRRLDDMTVVEEALDFLLYNTVITDHEAYYVIQIFSVGDGSEFVDTFNVNAATGAVSTWFDGDEYAEVEWASQGQTLAVISYLKEHSYRIPEDGTFRSFMVNKDYMLFATDFAELTFKLSEADGFISVEPYHEWDGD